MLWYIIYYDNIGLYRTNPSISLPWAPREAQMFSLQPGQNSALLFNKGPGFVLRRPSEKGVQVKFWVFDYYVHSKRTELRLSENITLRAPQQLLCKSDEVKGHQYRYHRRHRSVFCHMNFVTLKGQGHSYISIIFCKLRKVDIVWYDMQYIIYGKYRWDLQHISEN